MYLLLLLFGSSAHHAGKTCVCTRMAVIPDVQIFVLLLNMLLCLVSKLPSTFPATKLENRDKWSALTSVISVEMISGWLGSMCVCFSVRNQVYCNYFAVAVIKLTKIVGVFSVEEKSSVFFVSLGKNMLQSESSCFLPPEESYAFSAFLTFFPRPPRRWEQTIPLPHICVWRVSQTLYFCSVT